MGQGRWTLKNAASADSVLRHVAGRRTDTAVPCTQKRRIPHCSLRRPLSERYRLAAFAARRLNASHRQGCRAEISKVSIFWPYVRLPKHVGTRTETILHIVLKYRQRRRERKCRSQSGTRTLGERRASPRWIWSASGVRIRNLDPDKHRVRMTCKMYKWGLPCPKIRSW